MKKSDKRVVLAHSLDIDRLYSEVKKAMPSMLIVEPSCEYYSLVGDNVVLFYPSKLSSEDKTGLHLINGRIYEKVGAGPFEYFKNQEIENETF